MKDLILSEFVQTKNQEASKTSNLPVTVTEEPQDVEHMHLQHISH